MNVIFLEPGGDSTFDTGLFHAVGGPSVVTDFVHGNHLKSLKFSTSVNNVYVTVPNALVDAGNRFSAWFYVNAYPSADSPLFGTETVNDGTAVIDCKLSSAGLIKLSSGANALGSGSTFSTGVWTRICLAYTITSTTVNQIRLFKNGSTDITVSNGTLQQTGSSDLIIGNYASGGITGVDKRVSDIYIDNSTSLLDVGNVWVTAKRPHDNGTSVQFTTQIGAGGSGYGNGHTPQVNERPQSDTNGWSIQNAAKQTEEYSIETAGVGDINIVGATIVDFMGWIRAKVGVASTGNIILAGVASNISVTTGASYFTKVAGSTTYPAGNTDIGMDTNTVNQLFSLLEAGINIAYIPALTNLGTNRLLMGVGT